MLEGRSAGDKKECIPPRKGDPRLERELADKKNEMRLAEQGYYSREYISCLL